MHPQSPLAFTEIIQLRQQRVTTNSGKSTCYTIRLKLVFKFFIIQIEYLYHESRQKSVGLQFHHKKWWWFAFPVVDSKSWLLYSFRSRHKWTLAAAGQKIQVDRHRFYNDEKFLLFFQQMCIQIFWFKYISILVSNFNFNMKLRSLIKST